MGNNFTASISYKKFQILMVEEKIKPADVRRESGLSPALFTKINKDMPVSIAVILAIAEALSRMLGREVGIEEICSITYEK